MNNERNYWMHRITYERDVKQLLLDHSNLLLTGWGFTSNDVFLNEVRNGDKQRFDDAYCRVTGKLSHNRYFLYMFLNEFKKGDYVVVPGNKDFSVYEITSEKPMSNEHIWEKTSDPAMCNIKQGSDGKLYRIKDNSELELGFFWEVKPVELNISREQYASDNLRKRLKFQGTTNNITSFKKDVVDAVERFRANNPINLHTEIIEGIHQDVLSKLQKLSSDSSFEKVVKFYMEKIGASKVEIPAKTKLSKAEGDADVIANFDDLQVRIIIQVKHYLKEVDENAVKQIVLAQTAYEDPNYTIIPWVVAACDTFTEKAQIMAEEEGVRLIGGSEFSSSLLDVGFRDLLL